MKDQYLINMRFTEELLQFLFTEAPLFGFRVQWHPNLPLLAMDNKTEECCDSMFDEEIGWAVYNIIGENTQDIVQCYEDFFFVNQSMESEDAASNFARCAMKIAPSFFCSGYSHGSFLAYCAMVIGVAYNFLLMKPNLTPQCACQVVALVLFSHQMTGQFYEMGGWEGFYQTAFNFNSRMADLDEKRNKK